MTSKSITMDFSTAEWKARIAAHETSLTKEIDTYQKNTQMAEYKFLDTISTSCKTELTNLISNLEESHQKSREATLSILHQLYTDFDNYKKQSQHKIYDLDNKLATSDTDSEFKKISITHLESQLQQTKDELSKTNETLNTSMKEYFEETQKSKKLETKLLKTENFLQISTEQHSSETHKSQNLELKLGDTETQLATALQNIKNLNSTLALVTHEKDMQIQNLTENGARLQTLLSAEKDTCKSLRKKLAETEDTLETSMTEHAQEISKSNILQMKLTKTENGLELCQSQHSEEIQKSMELNVKLKTTEKELKDTKVDLKMLKMDKKDADETVEVQEGKIKELSKKFGACERELEEARGLIANLKENQKQRTGPTADFFKGVRIVNVPPFVCDGTQKSMVYLNVSEMVELESIGFLGPLNCDAVYEVMIQVNIMKPKGNKWKGIAHILKKVTARRQQVFHVDFDEPIVLDDYATEGKNSFTSATGFYSIYYSLKGPNTQSADILNGADCKEMTKEVDRVKFYTKWYHNHWAELGFQKC